jgi:predicted dienelactone hydrolase
MKLNITITHAIILGVIFIYGQSSLALAQNETYDPLHVTVQDEPQVLDLVVQDVERNREIPILIYLPVESSPAPIVLFSHGLGGSRHGSAYLGSHWATRGFVVVYVQHPGSDRSVWEGVPREDRMDTMRDAANLKNFRLRVNDILAVLDQLEQWNLDPEHTLYDRLDMERVGMSGHSFGAITTQAVSGQRTMGSARFTDSRIKAAVMFSPNTPRMGRPSKAFGSISTPWMLMTGTKDGAPIGHGTPETRQQVYAALPPGDKYELVLYNAEHSAFSDRALPGDTEPRNPNHHRAILALSTAFWDTYLKDDPAARNWLQGAGTSAILEPNDRWQTK